MGSVKHQDCQQTVNPLKNILWEALSINITLSLILKRLGLVGYLLL